MTAGEATLMSGQMAAMALVLGVLPRRLPRVLRFIIVCAFVALLVFGLDWSAAVVQAGLMSPWLAWPLGVVVLLAAHGLGRSLRASLARFAQRRRASTPAAPQS
ncbi:hypothetical protein AAG589_21045 [Isoptericola sp. F-RaC21]|uniref:hypothetical protein n=1 Tax=Isoptericola sp. F-RaC21 TaxID=3141452 RepID=UPI00315B523E